MTRISPANIGNSLAVASLLCACTKAPPASPGSVAAPPQDQTVLARVGTQFITVETMQEQINREGAYIRMRYSSPEKKKEFLDNLIRFEVLALEAERRGFANDPDIVRTFKQQLVARLIQKDFEPQHDPASLPQEEVRQFYEEHREEFDDPEERRFSQIVVADTATANKVLAEARKLKPNDHAGFARLVGAHSIDQPSQQRDGDMGFVTAATTRIPKPMVEALFALAKAGDLTGPLPTPEGQQAIVRLTQVKPALKRTYEEAATLARNRLFRQRRAAALKEWVSGLRARTDVTIFEEALAKVAVDTTDAPPRKDTRPPVMNYLDTILPGQPGVSE